MNENYIPGVRFTKLVNDLTNRAKTILGIENEQDVVPAYEESGVEVAGAPSNNMAVINMGTGIIFDTDQVNNSLNQGGIPYDPSNPARHMIQQQIPPQPTQIPPNPMLFQQPVHKVDEPPKQPKPKPAEDNIGVNIPDMNIDSMKVPPVVKQAPEIIQSIPQAEPIDNTVSNLFDNSVIIDKFPKVPLKRIQEIANQNSCTVKYDENPHIGLISVMTFDHIQNRYVPEKSFVIDTGMIIDKRIKFFAHNPTFNRELMLEFAPVYELLTSESNGRKTLDEKMINDVFVAGHANISKKEMYTESYKKLNTKVALISLPTKGLNKEERVSLQNYVIKMDQDGYFDSAIKMSPGSRFVFLTKQLDRNNLSDFTLVNEGVPAFYGTIPFNVTPIIIESKGGQVNIRSTCNPSETPAPAVYPAQ